MLDAFNRALAIGAVAACVPASTMCIFDDLKIPAGQISRTPARPTLTLQHGPTLAMNIEAKLPGQHHKVVEPWAAERGAKKNIIAYPRIGPEVIEAQFFQPRVAHHLSSYPLEPAPLKHSGRMTGFRLGNRRLRRERQVFGQGRADCHIELIAFQDTNFVWQAGGDLTSGAESSTACLSSGTGGGGGGAPGAPVLSADSTVVESDEPFTLSWSVPSGSIDHYTLSSTQAGTTTTTTLPASTTSQTYTKKARKADKFFDYKVHACSTADESVCGVWSNTVEIDVTSITGGCPTCR